MVRRNLDLILIALGFILVVTNAVYLILEVKPENVRSIVQVVPSLVGMVMGWIGMLIHK